MSSSKKPRVVKRDETHFWDFVVFLVEDTLFKVPKHRFSQSSGIFATTFSLPQSQENMNIEGESEENPFNLDGIKKVDFKRFLAALYPLNSSASELQTTDEWLSVLRLATMWEFLDIRQMAMDKLAPLTVDPIDRIVLARSYDIHKWLCSGYYELAQRENAIAKDEALRMGFETAYRLQLVREEAKDSEIRRIKGIGGHFDYTLAIKRQFDDDFKGVDVGDSDFAPVQPGQSVAVSSIRRRHPQYGRRTLPMPVVHQLIT